MVVDVSRTNVMDFYFLIVSLALSPSHSFVLQLKIANE